MTFHQSAGHVGRFSVTLDDGQELHLDASAKVGVLSRNGSSIPVVVRNLGSRRRRAEWHALTLISRAGSNVPAPTPLGTYTLDDEQWGVISAEGASDLWSLLPSSAGGPPPPPGTQSSASAADAETICRLVGHIAYALRALHAITLPEFGLLVDNWTEPWVRNARAFTDHEALYALQRCAKRRWIDEAGHARIADWFADRLEAIDGTEPARLVHFDLHPGNIRVGRNASEAWTLSALVDFEHALGWLPEFDLATLSNYLTGVPGAEDTLLAAYGVTDVCLPRFELCRALRLVITLGARGPEDPWGRWCADRLEAMVGRYLLR